MKETTAFPLTWPENRPRSRSRKTAGHFKTGFARARDHCSQEIHRLGGNRLIISTNIPLKRDGLPCAVDYGKAIPDPGVAVYFHRNGKDLCFACDCWNHVQDNMHAIALTIEALRGIARWGTGDMMEAAFRGFSALPDHTNQNWWEVLGVVVNAEAAQIKEAYRALAMKYHPDTGGETANTPEFIRVQKAWEQSQRS